MKGCPDTYERRDYIYDAFAGLGTIIVGQTQKSTETSITVAKELTILAHYFKTIKTSAEIAEVI